MKYMDYEIGATMRQAKVTPLNLHKKSTDINKMTGPQIFAHLYLRYEILLLYVALAAISTFVFIKG